MQVVSAWKESGKLKDLKIEELNFQLGQAAAQLEAAKQEAAALQQQLADSTTKVCIEAHQPALACIYKCCGQMRTSCGSNSQSAGTPALQLTALKATWDGGYRNAC